MSERRGSAKNSQVGQAKNAVRGSVIRLLIKLLKGKLFTPTLEIAEDRTHQKLGITGQEMPTAVGEEQEKHLDDDHGTQMDAADETTRQ